MLRGIRCADACVSARSAGTGLDWIIVGGESGPGARPFDIQWARDTIGQCRDAGVIVFVKQLGSNCYAEVDGMMFTINLKDRKGGVREFPL